MRPSPFIALFTMQDQSALTPSSWPRIIPFLKSFVDKETVSLELSHSCGKEKEVVLFLPWVLSSQLVKDMVLLER